PRSGRVLHFCSRSPIGLQLRRPDGVSPAIDRIASTYGDRFMKNTTAATARSQSRDDRSPSAPDDTTTAELMALPHLPLWYPARMEQPRSLPGGRHGRTFLPQNTLEHHRRRRSSPRGERDRAVLRRAREGGPIRGSRVPLRPSPTVRDVEQPGSSSHRIPRFGPDDRSPEMHLLALLRPGGMDAL